MADIYYSPETVTVLLFVFMVVIVITNGSVAGLLLIRKRLLTVSNLYVAFLSMSQLLVGSFVIISTEMSFSVIKHPKAWCSVAPFFELFSFTSGIFFLIGISVDRYRSVMQPLTYKPTIKNTIAIIFVLMVSAAIYSLQIFIHPAVTQDDEDHNEDTIDDNQKEATYCNLLNEDDSSDLWFRIVDFIMLLIIPTIAMSFMYFQIIMKLWAKNVNSNESIKKKRMAARLSVTCVTTFIVCWLPFHVIEIIYDGLEMTTGREYSSDNYHILRFTAIFFALFNSVLNPIIYGFLNKNFQRELMLMKNSCFITNKIGNTNVVVKTVSIVVDVEGSNKSTDQVQKHSSQSNLGEQSNTQNNQLKEHVSQSKLGEASN